MKFILACCVYKIGSKIDLAQDHWCSSITYESYSLSLCLQFQSELCVCFHLNCILVFEGRGKDLQPTVKFSKPGFNSTRTVNFQMFKLDLEKSEEPEIKLPASAGSSKKQESSRKTSTSALLTMPKPLTVWSTTNCGKFLKGWEYQTTLPASWEICMLVKKQQLEWT